MNKKGGAGLPIKIVVEVILLLIVLFIVLPYFGINLTEIAKAQIGIIDEALPIDYTEVNERDSINLNILIKELESCRDSKDTKCGCETTFSGFFKTHLLSIDKNKIQLLNIKNLNNNLEVIKEGKVNPITIDQKDFSNLNCFFDENLEKKELTPLLIAFFEENPFIFEEGRFFDTEHEFLEDFELYKTKEEICWLTEKVKEEVKECK